MRNFILSIRRTLKFDYFNMTDPLVSYQVNISIYQQYDGYHQHINILYDSQIN